jgi:hypothetical protein
MTRDEATAEAARRQRLHPDAKWVAVQRNGEWVVAPYRAGANRDRADWHGDEAAADRAPRRSVFAARDHHEALRQRRLTGWHYTALPTSRPRRSFVTRERARGLLEGSRRLLDAVWPALQVPSKPRSAYPGTRRGSQVVPVSPFSLGLRSMFEICGSARSRASGSILSVQMQSDACGRRSTASAL